jgi:gamma-glutamyltranspeptidase / glutathione hydrolase
VTLRPGRRIIPLQRSAVVAPTAMVAASQALAAQAGLQMLREGGSAADAGVAAAAVVTVTEPHMSGIGGDTTALFYDSASRELYALNATGTAGALATPDRLRGLGLSSMPERGPHTVTVPGALAGWQALLDRFGRFSLSRVLEPAIAYAEGGVPIAEVAAAEWSGHALTLATDPGGDAYLVSGRAPEARSLFRNPSLAATYREIAKEGAEYFYRGPLGARIAAAVEGRGGLLRLPDLASYTPRWVAPLSTTYRGATVWELPPNSQGFVALEMLNILEGASTADPVDYFHTLVEAKKLAFADRLEYLADPSFEPVPTDVICSKDFADSRRRAIGPIASPEVIAGSIPAVSDTSNIAAIDESRNVLSMMTSLFTPFGSGVVVEGTGIILHNRGRLFSFDPGATWVIGPGRRPPHTLMPAMVFRGERPWFTLGVIGGHQQPQGQVQVLVNVLEFGMAIQDAVDAPRVAHMEGLTVHFDSTFSPDLVAALRVRAHQPDQRSYPHGMLGRAQVIEIDHGSGTLAGASDWRMDGLAAGY